MFTVNQLLNSSILITSIPSCSTLWQDYTLLIWWLWSPRQLFCQSFLGFFIFQTGQYDIDICKLWVNILGECGTRVRSGVTVTTATTTVQEITPVEHSDIVCLLEDEFLNKCLREETCWYIFFYLDYGWSLCLLILYLSYYYGCTVHVVNLLNLQSCSDIS